MNHRITALLASAAMTFVGGAAFAQTTAPMSVSLAANATPASFDLGPLGNKVYVTGALTGLALTEDHSLPGVISNQADISNAQIMVSKADGLLQYFVEVGNYSYPSLGYPYVKSGPNTNASFGIVPIAYAKIAPTSSFSIQGGKLPTLIGAEYNFTFQNLNIERGLLWGFEPAVSRGVQANYSQGPFAVSVSFNDGLYSNQYNTVSGLATWTITPADILAVAASGTTKKTTFSALNNQTIYNVMYTHTMGQWTFNPYFQYQDIPKYVPVGQTKSQQIASGALLVNYAFDSKSSLAGFSLPVRGEYVTSTGFQKYNVWSITATPTYQYKIYFIRAEVSYTAANIGLFGSTGAAKSQTRGVVETGVLF